jgi:Reverse transcriptase (RNA-dependent DNA polymerase)
MQTQTYSRSHALRTDIRYSAVFAVTIQLQYCLFNMIWHSEHIPASWRKGRVVNLFSAGDATQCGNYRPITLLPVLDKLFSSVLTARLMQHVPVHDHQYAFWKNRGTHQPRFALATVMQARKHAGLSTYAFFLDVRQAYDTVPHDALMYTLHRKGVQGKCLRVIQAMYAGASSRVAYGGSVSEPYPIGQGVAQGCPMSPLSYAVFMMSSCMTCTPCVLTMAFSYRRRPVTSTLTALKATQTTLWGLLCRGPVCSGSSMWCMPTATAGNGMPTSPSNTRSRMPDVARRGRRRRHKGRRGRVHDRHVADDDARGHGRGDVAARLDAALRLTLVACQSQVSLGSRVLTCTGHGAAPGHDEVVMALRHLAAQVAADHGVIRAHARLATRARRQLAALSRRRMSMAYYREGQVQ